MTWEEAVAATVHLLGRLAPLAPEALANFVERRWRAVAPRRVFEAFHAG